MGRVNYGGDAEGRKSTRPLHVYLPLMYVPRGTSSCKNQSYKKEETMEDAAVFVPDIVQQIPRGCFRGTQLISTNLPARPTPHTRAQTRPGITRTPGDCAAGWTQAARKI